MSDDSDDDFVEFGTPLEPLEEHVCPRKKPLLIEDQVVKDKDGRRRFHGAFTGGFSAGYLNTVGSAEGFKPSSFKSSRSEKGAAVVQRPEDFMDEEDMGDFGIAPSVLRARDDFQSVDTLKRTPSNYLFGRELGTVLQSLLQPVRETVGIKLLKKMGWKPGQGVGPRITQNEKKRTSRMKKKVFGCLLPNEKSDGDESEASDVDDEDLKNITFAPSDYPFQMVVPKNNFFGLGYKGLDRRSILSAPVAQTQFQVINKKTITGQAFGVGALEEEDEDIYSKEDMSQYDFTLGDKAKEVSFSSSSILEHELYDIFVLSSKMKPAEDFRPPILPSDFKPVRKLTKFDKFLKNQNQSSLTTSPERKSKAEEAEEIQREARKLTENMTADTPEVFKPFVGNPDKQKRYEMYLNLVALGKPGDICKHQPITMTNWEKEKEQAEFDQAAKIFRPLKGTIDDRFTTASQPDNVNDPLEPVERFNIATHTEIEAARSNMYGDLTRTIVDWTPCSLLCKRFNVPEPRHGDVPVVEENKAKPKVVEDFERSLLEAKAYEQNRDSCHVKTSTQNQGDGTTLSEPPETDVNGKVKKSGKTGNSDVDNLMQNKVDLFNAIFQDTDSDEEEVVEVHDDGKITAEYFEERNLLGEYDKELGMQYEDDIVNDKRNTSPARGLFENLDYDLLIPKNQKTVACPQPDDAVPGPSNYKPPTTEERNTKSPSPDLQYGPKLPDKFPDKTVGFVLVDESANLKDVGVWVEKRAERKKHNKNKKHKKTKTKSKNKKKNKHKGNVPKTND